MRTSSACGHSVNGAYFSGGGGGLFSTAGERYGLGVRVITDRAARNTLLSNGSFGWSGAFNTHFLIDPEENVIGIFMTQSTFLATRQQLRDYFERAVMQALVDEAVTR